MIEEKHIELCLQKLESKETDDTFLEEKELVDYLKSDTFSSLSNVERQTLYFCFEVVFYSYLRAKKEKPEFDIDDYLDAEEENWQLRESQKDWPTTVNVFFKDYAEEDLLAFLEDTLVEEADAEDEENKISEIAKEVIFISSKSYIDSILI